MVQALDGMMIRNDPGLWDVSLVLIAPICDVGIQVMVQMCQKALIGFGMLS